MPIRLLSLVPTRRSSTQLRTGVGMQSRRAAPRVTDDCVAQAFVYNDERGMWERGEVVASRYGKLELPSLSSQAGAWELTHSYVNHACPRLDALVELCR